MSEEFREQRPLLCEEVSEDDQLEYSRSRFRLPLRGRAKASVKGAAAIINRWPEHWSSALGYWWMGLGIMALITFVIYNSLIAFAFLPISAQKRYNSPQKIPDSPMQTSAFPEVYMHVFTDSDEKVDLAKYLPYINIISDKYLEFNFNFIIVINDTVTADNTLSAEENNLVAFNSIWSKDRFYRKPYHLRKNFKVIHKTLSQYLELLPLSVDWRKISPQFIPLLVKAFAIWDLGGISINPDILTPRSPHVTYIDKFYNILNKYTAAKEDVFKNEKPRKDVMKEKEHKVAKELKVVNNIQDIIENLQSDSDENNDTYIVENLTEAENRNDITSNNGRKLFSTFLFESKNTNKTNSIQSGRNETESFDHKFKQNNNERLRGEFSEDSNASKLSILPLFLEWFFHGKNDVESIQPEKSKIDNSIVRRRKRRDTVIGDKMQEETSSFKSKTLNKKAEATTVTSYYKPMIVNVKHSTTVPDTSKISNSIPIENTHKIDDELTIDLKGNILATKVSCHAFIGSIFSNVIHHKPEETIQEFIIKELSLFCKGILSSCNGIEVILI